MFTVCPKCGLMLIVTAADLRAAQGHVRCGRCRNVFNALESLSETAPQETAAQAAPPHSSAPGPEAEAPEDLWVGPEEVPPEQDPQPARPDAPQDDGFPVQAAEPPPDSDPESPAQREPETPASAEDAPAEFELETAREARTGRWLAGGLLLALVLVGQLINHYRGTLATMPSVGPTVRGFYGALGIPIVPLWNVRAYEARQLGATVSGSNPHQITVRASIANRGSSPLPLPLLRVTLQDRYGRTIAARDVPPRDYLPPSGPAAAMLPAGGRIDATVAFVNPGPRAIGFEIDACLREGAALECAHGAR